MTGGALSLTKTPQFGFASSTNDQEDLLTAKEHADLPAHPAVWTRQPGTAPVAVVMISLNEAHNMEAVLQNLKGWAQEVFLVDSYSADTTVDIALRHGVHVVQREFRGFADQWNFAMRELPISAPWTMKLDPDERLPDPLKRSLISATSSDDADGLTLDLRLWFMDRPLPIKLIKFLRLWRTGRCRFTDVQVNEHPLVDGTIRHVHAELEHHDSPDLDHWLHKQNCYTTAEAVTAYQGLKLAGEPRLLGSSFERRMWLKKHYTRVPLRYQAMFLYHYFGLGAYRAGWVGYAWSRLRCDVYRLQEYKLREMRLTGRLPMKKFYGPGRPDPRVPQF
jgi:glycosyltransferase involved in cell wall biosynthesis